LEILFEKLIVLQTKQVLLRHFYMTAIQNKSAATIGCGAWYDVMEVVY